MTVTFGTSTFSRETTPTDSVLIYCCNEAGRLHAQRALTFDVVIDREGSERDVIDGVMCSDDFDQR